MRILDLTLKDLSQMARDRRSLLFLVAMPIVFTLFMGMAFGSMASQPADPRLALGWVTHDPDGALSRQLLVSLNQSDALRVVPLDAAQASDRVSRGDVAGVLSVPDNFSADVLAGRPAQLSLLTDPVSTRGQSLAQALRAVVTRLMSSAAVARLDAQTIAAQKPFGAEADRQAELQAAFTTASAAWDSAATGSLLKIEAAAGPQSAPALGGNPYNQTSPGILVQFAIFGLVSSAQILVQERKTRTLQRLLTTNMKPWQIVAGHLLAMFAVVFLQTALLVAFGQWVLGVNYLREPLGTLLVALTLGLWVASMGLLIGAIAKGEDQVVLFSLIAMFLFAGLGGAWFPLESSGQAFSIIGHLTPAAWAIDGFQNILVRGLSLPSVWLPAVILLAYAAGFFGLAVWRLKLD